MLVHFWRTKSEFHLQNAGSKSESILKRGDPCWVGPHDALRYDAIKSRVTKSKACQGSLVHGHPESPQGAIGHP